MGKTARIDLRVTPALKKAAERAAGADGRSLTNWIERVIEEKAKETKR